jgi:hypothetical protein
MKTRILHGAMIALLGMHAMAEGVDQNNVNGDNRVTYTNCQWVYIMGQGNVCTLDHPLPNLMKQIRSSSIAEPIQPKPHVAPAQPTSTANTVYDASTGLRWQDDPDAKIVKKDWAGAKSYCANLTLDGYSDWRLPSYSELLTLVEYTKYNPAIKTGFKNTATDNYYWSASPSVFNDSNAWVVNFRNGNTYRYTKTDKNYVRCVRGRQ